MTEVRFSDPYDKIDGTVRVPVYIGPFKHPNPQSEAGGQHVGALCADQVGWAYKPDRALLAYLGVRGDLVCGTMDEAKSQVREIVSELDREEAMYSGRQDEIRLSDLTE